MTAKLRPQSSHGKQRCGLTAHMRSWSLRHGARAMVVDVRPLERQSFQGLRDRLSGEQRERATIEALSASLRQKHSFEAHFLSFGEARLDLSHRSNLTR